MSDARTEHGEKHKLNKKKELPTPGRTCSNGQEGSRDGGKGTSIRKMGLLDSV